MAELLHCQLQEVGGRTYRVYSGGAGRAEQRHQEEEDQWEAARPAQRFDEEEDEEMGKGDESIVQEGGQFLCRLELDAEVLPFIIGKKGATKQRIEQDTGARLHIPRKDPGAGPASGGGSSSSSSVTVRGDSRGCVARARTQLDLVVASALSRLEYNFFISLPLATPEVRAAAEAFKQSVLAEPWAAAAGIEESIFMKPAHLHLTLTMLKLYSEERRQLARQVLQSLAPTAQQLLQGQPLQVQLKGLEYMNDDPSQMHVMFLGVRDPLGVPGALQRLQQLCAAVVQALAEAGLLLPQDERDVKLHATVLNTRYRRPAGPPGFQQQQQQAGAAGRPRFDRQPFDGRPLLGKYTQADFGVVELPALHLSQRGRYSEGGPYPGFYYCADSLPLRPQ